MIHQPSSQPAALILSDRIHEHVVLTLNRPDKLNALSYELIDVLMAQLDAVEADDSIRCVVLTGAGQRAFSAGADIAGFAPDVRASPEQACRRFVSRGQALTRRIESFTKPIIAAVNGLAFGGGCETVEACTLAIAAEHAVFAKPEIKLGFPPPFGGSQRLPRHIGRKPALEMLLTGDAITAARACELGLVNRVVDASHLLDESLALASRISRQHPAAVAATLRAVSRGINLSIDEALHVEAMQFMQAVATPGAVQGLTAFLDRGTSKAASPASQRPS